MKGFKIIYDGQPRDACLCHDFRNDTTEVVLPLSTSDKALFATLHEYAHIALGHHNTISMFYGTAYTEHEVETDRLCLRWIRPELRDKAIRFYLSMVAPSKVFTRSWRETVKRQLASSQGE